MDSALSSAAPAQPETPDELTAVQAATVDDNFAKFQEARRAERQGKPLDPVDLDDPKPVAAKVADPAAPVSKRQQKINDYERRIAEQDAELTRLRTAPKAAPEVPAARSEPERPVAAAPALRADAHDPEPQSTDLTKYPGGEDDPRFIRDAAVWEIRQENRREAAAAHTRATADAQTKTLNENVTKLQGAFNAKRTADPEFQTRLNGDLMARLKPAASLGTGEVFGPLNAIAEEMLASPDTAPDLAEYLSTNPTEVDRLTTLGPRALIRELGRLEGRLAREAAAAPSPEPTTTVTNAPEPAIRLGRKPGTEADPQRAAVINDDFGKFQAAKRAKVLAGRR